jgi:choice-of-anchor B domain-containing protein
MKKLLLLILTGSCFNALFSQSSHNMDLIYSWTDTNIAEINAPPSIDQFRYNDVWGYEQNGREYAILGSTMGVHFFDITDTTILDYIDFVPGRVGPIVHHEFNNYKNYLYVVSDEGSASLQIIDLQYLPDSVHLVYDNDSLIIRSHEIHVDTAMDKVYLFGITSDFLTPGTPVGYAAMVLDVDTPQNPEFLGMFYDANINYIHDGFVRNDTAFFNGGYDGLWYGYMGDPQNPVEIDVMPFYLDQGYNHSGWLTPNGKYYFMLDETQGMRIKTIDMQPGLNFFTVCGLFQAGVGPFNMAHNPHIKGDYLYVSYYQDGVRIFDITNACSPTEVAWYDTWPADALSGEYRGAWGVYGLLSSGKVLVADMQTGLYVLRPHNMPIGIENNSSFSFRMSPNPTTDLVYFSENFENIAIIDAQGKTIRNFKNESTISLGDLATGIYMIEVVKDGNRAYKKLVKE